MIATARLEYVKAKKQDIINYMAIDGYVKWSPIKYFYKSVTVEIFAYDRPDEETGEQHFNIYIESLDRAGLEVIKEFEELLGVNEDEL